MKDYMRDANNNYLVQGGDFVRGESTGKHQKDIILKHKGEYKQNPTVGVGAFDYLNDENIAELARAVAVQFSADGMNVVSVQLGANGIINSDAYYK